MARKKPAKPKKSGFTGKSTAEEVTEGVDLSGKTAFITGVNSGLGLETMRVLAKRGAHIIGAARSLEKATEACQSIEGKTTPVACELSDYDSVVSCADQVRSMQVPIDMLICNAGIMALPKLHQVDGVELQFRTNHLGHFVLVNRLLDAVRVAPAGRVVMLSSSAHRQAPKGGIQFDNLDGEKKYTAWSAYGQSKLANILFAVELARRLEGTNATANSLHPGVIPTNLGRHMSGLVTALFGLVGGVIFKSVEQGASTTCYVAAHPDLDGISGHYFADNNPQKPSAYARNGKLAIRLWEESEKLTRDYL